MSIYRTLAQCKRPELYVSQDFVPTFQAPGIWDRASGKRLILHAREVLSELRQVSRRKRDLTKQLRILAQLIEDTVNNADPYRSPE